MPAARETRGAGQRQVAEQRAGRNQEPRLQQVRVAQEKRRGEHRRRQRQRHRPARAAAFRDGHEAEPCHDEDADHDERRLAGGLDHRPRERKGREEKRAGRGPNELAPVGEQHDGSRASRASVPGGPHQVQIAGLTRPRARSGSLRGRPAGRRGQRAGHHDRRGQTPDAQRPPRVPEREGPQQQQLGAEQGRRREGGAQQRDGHDARRRAPILRVVEPRGEERHAERGHAVAHRARRDRERRIRARRPQGGERGRDRREPPGEQQRPDRAARGEGERGEERRAESDLRERQAEPESPRQQQRPPRRAVPAGAVEVAREPHRQPVRQRVGEADVAGVVHAAQRDVAHGEGARGEHQRRDGERRRSRPDVVVRHYSAR